MAPPLDPEIPVVAATRGGEGGGSGVAVNAQEESGPPRSPPVGGVSSEPIADFDASEVAVLVVGAGGIGCELVKTLVLSGFCRIGIVDLDTVDITNLNRQFFFRKAHVGMSKAQVLASACSKLFTQQQLLKIGAAAAAAGTQPATQECSAAAEDELVSGDRIYGLLGMRGNIMSACFTVSFVSSFDIVFAALDNLQARRHLNRLCLGAEKPLIEAGSTGYSGQVVPIVPHQTLCFDCEAKPNVKDRFPVCTLRQHPEKPEHCVAWAKMLYELLFGLDNADNLLVDLKAELEALLSTASSNWQDVATAGKRVMEEVFSKQIKDLRILKTDWKGKDPPNPLQLHPDLQRQVMQRHQQHNTMQDFPAHRLWSSLECQQAFLSSFCSLMKKKHEMQNQDAQGQQQKQLQGVPFDKDDDLAMDFTRWELQAIAGSIIPAIASTNAIVAALQVVQAQHLLRGLTRLRHQQAVKPQGQQSADELKETVRDTLARQVWVKPFVTGRHANRYGSLLLPEILEPPRASCFACQQIRLTVKLASLKSWNLYNFLKRVLIEALGFNLPFLDYGCNLIDPEEALQDDAYRQSLLSTSLQDAQISSGTLLTVTDFSQGEFQCDLLILEDPTITDKPEEAATAFLLSKPETTACDKGSNSSSSSSSTAASSSSSDSSSSNSNSPQEGGASTPILVDSDDEGCHLAGVPLAAAAAAAVAANKDAEVLVVSDSDA
ncbi:SUMO-activating enzyme subunit 2 [Cyclospora cayetanensis]|uniref:SUMO-activating enzyme subunit 2 n=1 Tax=Cyclospora cayetanensis TaxID=88456 RepID=A0A6P6RTA8_9EIME|nr:SUMO-activating enzyme subunit 2 [Cyclospora cayetanensis]